MLKNIPPLISPELIKILMEMGHGDELVIADGNFSAASNAKRLVRLDGLPVPPVLDAVLTLFPLDAYADPLFLMGVAEGDTYVPDIWDEYKRIVVRRSGSAFKFTEIERFKFYERARDAYAIIATGESALYANIILKKGVVGPN